MASPSRKPIPIEPRPLTPEEHAVAEFLLEGPLGREALWQQLDGVKAIGRCYCGCPSVLLAVPDGAPRAVFEPHESSNSAVGWVDLRAHVQDDWRREVTLHVSNGFLYELEIWEACGIGPDSPGAGAGIRIPAPYELAHDS